MSSVSSAGGSSLYQWLQQLSVQPQPGSTTAAQSNTPSTTPATTGVQDSDGDTDGSSGSATAAPAHHGHHGHHHGGGGVSTQLESAITSALGSATSSSDPNQVIQDAIKKFLQSGSSPTGTTDGTTAATATDPNPNGVTDPTDPAAQQAAFAQTLSAHGIDPKQFQQDLQSALQGSSTDGGGSVDFAKLFANFPPGSAVNVLA